jgi:hypothetical protein
MTTDPQATQGVATITEREAVRRERAAYARAMMIHGGQSWDEAHCAAGRVYPLPKVTRPRVVQDPNKPYRWFRVIGGEVYAKTTRYSDGEWTPLAGNWSIPATPEMIRLWVDLLANPTEEVEDDGR